MGPEREALAAIDSYMDAFNRRDLAGMDAALHVVARYSNEERAAQIAHGLEYDWRQRN